MPENFLLTKYFFPIQQPITLSRRFGFEFDNPRTEKEITHVKRFITDLYDSGVISVIPPYSKEDVVTLELIIKRFGSVYSKNNEYVKNFFRPYKRRYLFDYLAKMWCVIRFNDDGVSEYIDEVNQEMREKGQKGFVLLDDNSPALLNAQALINYCQLLSLLSHNEGSEYFGRYFIYNPDQLFEPVLLDNLTDDLIMLSSDLYNAKNRPEHRDSMDWIFWRFGSKEIIKNAQALEMAFDNGQAEQLLYIGGLLDVANRTHDIRIRLLILTSIIELLVTRNPDTSRFNVDDSINKQFQLKAGILIYLNNKEIDIELIKKRLKMIYQQRSNVAHGNFGEIDKISKKEGMHEHFDSLVSDLYAYVRAIIEEYLKDTKFVEFIKAG
jgi:uncharacterized protein YqgQ